MKFTFVLFLLWITAFLASCSNEPTPTPDISVTPETNTGVSVQDDSLNDNTTWMENNQETSENYYTVWNSYTFTTDSGEEVSFSPITHATMVMEWAGTVIYVDPAEPVESYADFKSPNVVLVTHEHGDHFNLEVLEAIVTENVELIVNDAVYQKLSPDLQDKAIVMANGDMDELLGFEITAIPAYNIREEALNYHPKGRDNGYVVEKDGFRTYISGDTEDTPEMRALTDIDVAFVSMNLPYTMPIDSAISWVSEFAPKTIFPYHFRGQDGMSDVERFQTEVEANNTNIEVVLAPWY